MDGVGKGVVFGSTEGEGCSCVCWAGGKVDVAPKSKKAKARARTGASSIFFFDQLIVLNLRQVSILGVSPLFNAIFSSRCPKFSNTCYSCLGKG
jgi:hypothetical protein